jgi:hypothetical protein
LERDPNWRMEIFGQYDLHNSGPAYKRVLRTNDCMEAGALLSQRLDERMKAIRDPIRLGQITQRRQIELI